MVDNEKYDDEYEFVDPDMGATDPLDYSPAAGSPAAGEQSIVDKTFAGKSGVIRNVLIVVVVVIVVMVVYPFVHSRLSGNNKTSGITPVAQQIKPREYIAPVTPVVVNDPMPDVSASKNLDEKVTQKLTALESSQERMQTEFASTNSQLSGINNNINEMMTKVNELNRITAVYASKVDEQAREIEQLTAQAAALKQAKTRPHLRPKMTSPALNYYIQAVIPGRAWLVATNGASLTVREGTVIAGLGMVKLIDPRQGRVVTSSGRVIRFSQEDS